MRPPGQPSGRFLNSAATQNPSDTSMPTLSRPCLRHRFLLCLPAVVFVCALASQTATYAATFTPLGYLPDGSRFSDAYGISANGQFVVGASHSGNGFEAFRWSAQS